MVYMSTLKDKVNFFVDSAKAIATNVINGEEVMCEPHLAEQRLSICNDCPALKNLGAMKMCSECGCTMNVKTKLADMKCPLGKW